MISSTVFQQHLRARPLVLAASLLVVGLLGICATATAQTGTNAPSSSSAFGEDIEGLVVDEHGHPLPGATVLLLPDSTGTVTDKDGRFRIEGGLGVGQNLEVRFLGYVPVLVKGPQASGDVAVVFDGLLRLVLTPSDVLMETICIVETHHHLEEALATTHLTDAELREADRSSLAVSLEAQPGVSVIRTGIGISKPVLRGLYGQRVVVQDQGIKQEGQQWGTDHGLEMDAFAAERVEVVKGPSSLLYGSDALGGAVRVLPPPAPEDRTVEVTAEGVLRSVNDHIGGSVSAGTRQGRFWIQGRYTRQSFGDFAVPADSFVFQGFALPIVDGILKNTAGREEALNASIGWLGERSAQRLQISRYDQAVGLFSGAVGIPRSYALDPDGDSRDIDNPSQSVRHDKLAYHLTLGGPVWDWTIDLGLQRNLRREFSFPEFHSLPVVDPNDNLALELDLWTASGSAHGDRDFGRGWTATLGADVQWQDNRAGGFERFLPDFRLWRSGLYGIVYHDGGRAGREHHWTFGLRLDAGGNETRFQQRYVYSSEGVIQDSLLNPASEGLYGNLAGSVGYNRKLGRRFGLDWGLRSHLGKSFRIPHPAEMVSNGVHHGTFRHEQGNPDLRSEHGYQLDLGLTGERPPLISNFPTGNALRWRLQLDAFFNAYQGFIYLSPSGRLSPLPEAGQVFAYRQDNAVFGGGELQVEVQGRGFGRKERMRLEGVFAGEAVYNRNLESGLPLPFTPPVSVRQRLGWRWEANASGRRSSVLQSAQVFAVARYTLAQNRVDRNEPPTPDFFLLEAGAGLDFRFGDQELQVLVKGFNLLNTAYLNHLSRYRLIGIPEPGRNISLSVRVPLLIPTGS